VKVVISHNVKLSNLYKIAKYDKEIGKKSENYQQNRNFHIVSIYTASAPGLVRIPEVRLYSKMNRIRI